jgi:outer membrane protein assembly factor BamB
MNSRAITTVVLAVVLIVAVMVVAAVITFAGYANNVKFQQETAWTVDFDGALSMNILNFTGDDAPELFVQNAGTVILLDRGGQELLRQDFSSGGNTTLGDVNGDGVEDIVIYDATGVQVLNGEGQELWAARPQGLGAPFRSAVVRFAGGTQVLVGDDRGQIAAYDSQGNELWRGATTITDYIRGLDDALVGGVRYAAVANHSGMIKVFDADGEELWEYQLDGTLRRMRAYDLDGDGDSEILAGGDGNRLVILDAATGAERFGQGLGQAITEIRAAELDGEPSALEFVVGGRDGGVWAYRGDGTRLWSARFGDRINEIAGLDIDDDGAEEVVVGTDDGQVGVFTGRGSRSTLASFDSAIGRIDAGRLSDSDQIAVADGEKVYLMRLTQQSAPFWYSPLAAGLVVSAIIACAAWFIVGIPPKPVLRVAAEDQSVEGLLARNRMLHEGLADVERLRGTGEMPAPAYLARLRELRRDLADTQAALQKAGQPIQLETFKCPNCGGALPLGLDKCDYCGQTVIA